MVEKQTQSYVGVVRGHKPNKIIVGLAILLIVGGAGAIYYLTSKGETPETSNPIEEIITEPLISEDEALETAESAEVNYSKKKYKKAIAGFSKVADVEYETLDRTFIYIRLGESYQQTGDDEKALTSYEKAKELNAGKDQEREKFIDEQLEFLRSLKQTDPEAPATNSFELEQ